jgi:ABC-2 type transport system ATP-binding protein
MIEVSNLAKAYPGVVAVDDISFRVDRGEIVGFLGPNGAGKTTTMRILTGFIAPTRGRVSVAGFDVVRQSMDVRRRVGYLPESNPLYAEMRVEEYLDFRARIKRVPGAERRRRVSAVVERCGLADRRDSIIGHLSKGYRQRVGIADAIVHNPEIIILDEPTIGLDPIQVREVRELIRELGKEHTVLLSSHILSEVEKLCGRVLILHRGKLVESGTPEEISNRLTKTGRVRLEIRGEGRSIRDELEKLPDVARLQWSSKGDMNTYVVEARDGVDVRPELFRFCTSRGWDVYELACERMSLEDAFAILTGGPGKGGTP